MPTTPMPASPPRLKPRGAEGVRIADASAMATITIGTTNTPTLMIAERTAS